MDYAELAKRLREFQAELAEVVEAHKREQPDWVRDNGTRSVTIVEYQLAKNDLGQEARLVKEAADAIEALTSPPDEAQVEAFREASEDYHERESHGEVFDPDVHHGATLAGLNAAHRVRVKP